MHAALDLETALKKHFGYDTFRPRQREIVADVLAGRDVFALLPTGGGKSLCFQLPALLLPGLTVVVSPLIALMKDQVDGLTAAGIPATFLNSSLEPAESRHRILGLGRGDYRLLYVAPERLLMDGFLDQLERFGVARIAVDEAHCISEWGHDFRPEYRRIAEVRSRFPDAPILALTATATPRVREDIVAGLELRDPSVHIASFNRPNLSYRVEPKDDPFARLLAQVESDPEASGIVYCHSRKGAEETAQKLVRSGVSAAAYHAGLEPDVRAKTQDRFVRDEIRVVCATVAFGMGINKPDVRFVVHYDIPKNVEGYYQETGRAGRDGRPADCLLLYSSADVVKLLRFLEEKSEDERSVARAQLRRITDYAETSACRRAFLLEYFGERWTDENCGSCDNCKTPRETYDGTLVAQKFMSCVFRIRERDGYDMGVNHVVEVLAGADTQKVRDRAHDTLSTYGIGKELSRPEWKAVAGQLVRLGLLRLSDDAFATVSFTAAGRELLKQRGQVTLTRSPTAPAAMRSGGGDAPDSGRDRPRRKDDDAPCDEALFDRLRGVRKRLADDKGVPAYVVFADAALRDMARRYPSNDAEFLQVSGVGESKLTSFGDAFLAEIAAHVSLRGKTSFAVAAPKPVRPAKTARAEDGPAALGPTVKETVRLVDEGLAPELVAARRGITPDTVFDHLVRAAESGLPFRLDVVLPSDVRARAETALDEAKDGLLRTAYEHAGGDFPYGLLRLVRALRRTRGEAEADKA